MLKAVEGKDYIIKLNDERACPLICKDSLCFIQRNYGADALSETCKIYPRNLIQLDTCAIKTLSLTCPIAAEAALFASNGMVLQQVTSTTEDMGWQLLRKNKHAKNSGLGSLVESVILGSVAILQNKRFTREERLIILGLFFDRADEIKDSDNAAAKVAELVITYQGEAFQEQVRKFLEEYSFNAEANRIFTTELLHLLAQEKKLGDVKDLLKQADTYNEDYQLWHGLLKHVYGEAIDNLWVQEFLHHGYPFRVTGSFMHNYFVYLLSYIVWEIFLFNFRKGSSEIISEDEMIMLIGMFCNISSHTRGFLDVLEKKIGDYENEPIKFMEMLIRLK